MTWLVHMCYDSFLRDVTQFFMCGANTGSLLRWPMTHPYGIWLIHMGHDSIVQDMTHSYMAWKIHTEHAPCTDYSVRDLSNVQVMSHVNKPCHIWTGGVIYERVMSHTSESCICDLSNVSNVQVVPFGLFSIHLQVEEGLHFSGNQKWCCKWMSHVTWEWVMSHMNESCHIWISHVTCEEVMLHVNWSRHMWVHHVT